MFPGQRMSGQMGNVTRTVQNLVVERIDTERGLLLVRGAVPGSAGGHLVITPSVKRRLKPVRAEAAEAKGKGVERGSFEHGTEYLERSGSEGWRRLGG